MNIQKIIYENCGVKNYLKEDDHSYRHNLQLQKESLKKIQACTGFKPLTSVIPVQCSTNWANKPTGSKSFNWFVINPWNSEDDDEVMNIWKSYMRTVQWRKPTNKETNQVPSKNTVLKMLKICPFGGCLNRVPL